MLAMKFNLSWCRSLRFTFILIMLLLPILYLRSNIFVENNKRTNYKLQNNEMTYGSAVLKDVDGKSVMKPKVILLYTSLPDVKYWPDNVLKTSLKDCQNDGCVISYDKEAVSTADAILFHGPDLDNFPGNFSADILRNISKQKRENQRWIFFIMESPFFHDKYRNYSNMFDWTMSYKYSSDIFVPYGYYEFLRQPKVVGKIMVNNAQFKTKLGIWLAGDCYEPRNKFAKELRNYIPITVVGKCAKKLLNTSVTCVHGSDDCNKFIKKHKFMFAFENSFCDYYVTEKYWNNGLELGLVPVVLGARYDNLTVIPGSYIDGLAYKSIKSLADYLLFLDANDDKYNEFFKWKLKYRIRLHKLSLCDACAALHENRPSKLYKDVWSADVDCKPFEWKVNLIDKLVNESRKFAGKYIR